MGYGCEVYRKIQEQLANDFSFTLDRNDGDYLLERLRELSALEASEKYWRDLAYRRQYDFQDLRMEMLILYEKLAKLQKVKK
jgi:hypothetical protein